MKFLTEDKFLPWRWKPIPLLFSILLILSGCQSPFLVFPGNELRGEVSHTNNFGFAKNYSLLQLETDPGVPYSVILRITVLNDQLYLDAAPGRQWHKNLQQNTAVRVKIGDTIYPAEATVVKDPAILEHFLRGRIIYQLLPSF